MMLLARAVIVALAGVLVWLPALALHVLICPFRAVSVVGWRPGPGSSGLARSGVASCGEGRRASWELSPALGPGGKLRAGQASGLYKLSSIRPGWLLVSPLS